MQTVQTVNELSVQLAQLRADGGSVALVPTMGALHAGHMALVDAAKTCAEHVVVSIFVNPKQFGPNEDLDAYPRPMEADVALLTAAGVDLLWMPPVREMYPEGFATTVSVAGLPDRLCGAARPGHFDGVTTVVSKLFGQVRPEISFFGEKDWQQLAIIKRMTTDLNLRVEIIGLPTVREADGLALSSRNAYLDKAEREAAAILPTTLQFCAKALREGKDVPAALAAAKQTLLDGGFQSVDYLELADGDTLEPVISLRPRARLFVAARIGKTRLIDNIQTAALDN